MSAGGRAVRSLLAIGFGVLAVFGVFGLAPASAAAPTGSLAVRTLDTTEWPNVRLTVQYTGNRKPRLTDFTVRNRGEIVSGVRVRPLAETQTPVGVVLVIDTSGSMREQGRMQAAKAAAEAFIAGRGPQEKIAVVAFSDAPIVVHPFTADNTAAAAIAELKPSGGTALWDAVRLATGLFTTEQQVQPNIVVLSDGEDSASTSTAGDARSAAIGAHAVVHTVAFGSALLDSAGLEALAAGTGGQSLVTTNTAGIGALFADVRRALDEQFELSWTAEGNAALELAVSVSDASTTAAGTAGAVSHERGTRPEKIGDPGLVSRIGQVAGRPITILAAVAVAVLIVLGVAYHLSDPRKLADRLRAYEADRVAPEEVEHQRGVSLASSAMTRGMVDAATNAMEGKGVLEWVEKKLDAARLPLRAAEAAFFAVAFASVLAILAFVLRGGFTALLAFVAGVGVPAAVLVFLGVRRKRKFVRQLPSMLQLLASSLRAGYALLQGCEAVAREMEDPMGAELRRVLAEARLGRPLNDALEEAAVRMDSDDFSWVVMAISIQREVGGNLAELLDTVSETMTARTRLRREVKALTAEGRVSALVLGFMPPALGVAMMVLSPGYLDPLFSQPAGQILLGIGILALVLGFVWMQKMIKVDI